MSRKKKKCYSGIGGQAVLEGVMMKKDDRYAVAVRRPDGGIEVKTEEYTGIRGSRAVSKIPFLRGVFNFIDSLVLGMKTLTWSAEFFEEEEPSGKTAAAQEDGEKKTGGKAAEKLLMGATVAFSIVMAVAIFIVLPYLVSMLFSSYVRNASLLAILEGVLRIAIFVGYVAAISAMKDIRRVYMYHGAEHKCINCIERGRELTVKNVRRSSRQHRRCGTSFLLFVMVVSVILFLFIRVENPVQRLLLRLALVPVIAGISYEVIRLAGRSENLLVRIISAPGMWLQKLTTREPDDAMIRVAIASVEAVFDWKAYLKETFGYDVDAWDKAEQEAKKEYAAEAAAEAAESAADAEAAGSTARAEAAGTAADAEAAGTAADAEAAESAADAEAAGTAAGAEALEPEAEEVLEPEAAAESEREGGETA